MIYETIGGLLGFSLGRLYKVHLTAPNPAAPFYGNANVVPAVYTDKIGEWKDAAFSLNCDS